MLPKVSHTLLLQPGKQAREPHAQQTQQLAMALHACHAHQEHLARSNDPYPLASSNPESLNAPPGARGSQECEQKIRRGGGEGG